MRARSIHDQIRFGRYAALESPNLFQRNVHDLPIGPVAQPGYFRVSSRVIVMGRLAGPERNS